MPNFSYVRAQTVDEAISLLKAEGARLHAGGTDLLGCLRDGVFPAERLVSISGISGLSGIRKTSGGLLIGSLTTVAELARDEEIRRSFPGLSQAAGSVASPQLRNQGTIGGNICQKPRCWYYRGEFHCLRKGGKTCYAVDGENQFHCIFGGSGCYIVHPSDIAPALTALDALVMIAGPGGRRTVRIAGFFVLPEADPARETILGNGEIVTGILLPPPAEGLRSSYRKVRSRGSWDFAVAGVALALRFHGQEVKDARVVLSAAAPVPWRSTAAESALLNRRIDRQAARGAAEEAMKGAAPLSRNAYKADIFRGLLEEQLLSIAAA